MSGFLAMPSRSRENEARGRQTQGVGKSASILVVDDQIIATSVLQSVLKSLGFSNVDKAKSVADAWALIENKRYDVVISDWHMGDGEGSELLKRLQAASHGRCPRFYVLTADASWGCRATARDSGADGIVIKPTRPAQLKQRLSELLCC